MPNNRKNTKAKFTVKPDPVVDNRELFYNLHNRPEDQKEQKLISQLCDKTFPSSEAAKKANLLDTGIVKSYSKILDLTNYHYFEKTYDYTIKLYKKLCESNNQNYAPELSNCLMTLGTIFIKEFQIRVSSINMSKPSLNDDFGKIVNIASHAIKYYNLAINQMTKNQDLRKYVAWLTGAAKEEMAQNRLIIQATQDTENSADNHPATTKVSDEYIRSFNILVSTWQGSYNNLCTARFHVFQALSFAIGNDNFYMFTEVMADFNKVSSEFIQELRDQHIGDDYHNNAQVSLLAREIDKFQRKVYTEIIIGHKELLAKQRELENKQQEFKKNEETLKQAASKQNRQELLKTVKSKPKVKKATSKKATSVIDEPQEQIDEILEQIDEIAISHHKYQIDLLAKSHKAVKQCNYNSATTLLNKLLELPEEANILIKSEAYYLLAHAYFKFAEQLVKKIKDPAISSKTIVQSEVIADLFAAKENLSKAISTTILIIEDLPQWRDQPAFIDKKIDISDMNMSLRRDIHLYDKTIDSIEKLVDRNIKSLEKSMAKHHDERPLKILALGFKSLTNKSVSIKKIEDIVQKSEFPYDQVYNKGEILWKSNSHNANRQTHTDIINNALKQLNDIKKNLADIQPGLVKTACFSLPDTKSATDLEYTDELCYDIENPNIYNDTEFPTLVGHCN